MSPRETRWGNYEVFDPAVWSRHRDLPHGDARKLFKKLMSEKGERINALRGLLVTNGLKLDYQDETIQELNTWFVNHVESDPVNSGRLLPRWYGVVADIALFLGDTLISQHPGLRWELGAGGKRYASHQRPVITGFKQEPTLDMDIDWRIGTYGHRIVQGLPFDASEFTRILKTAKELA